MKIATALLSCFIGLVVFQTQSLAAGDTTRKYFLDMRGQISFGKKGLSGASVTVFLDSSGTIVRKLESDEKGWIAFQLPIQKFYTIKISKPGHVTKIITVDGNIPKSMQTGDYYFEFSADLFEEIEGLDVSVLKYPVAKIFFNSFAKKFDYDFNYTAKVNADLKKLYENYKILRKKQNSDNSAKSNQQAADTSKAIKK